MWQIHISDISSIWKTLDIYADWRKYVKALTVETIIHQKHIKIEKPEKIILSNLGQKNITLLTKAYEMNQIQKKGTEGIYKKTILGNSNP